MSQIHFFALEAFACLGFKGIPQLREPGGDRLLGRVVSAPGDAEQAGARIAVRIVGRRAAKGGKGGGKGKGHNALKGQVVGDPGQDQRARAAVPHDDVIGDSGTPHVNRALGRLLSHL